MHQRRYADGGPCPPDPQLFRDRSRGRGRRGGGGPGPVPSPRGRGRQGAEDPAAAGGLPGLSQQTEPQITPEATVPARQGRLGPFVRGGCFLAAVLALWPVLPGVNSSLWIPALSPFVAVAGAIAGRQLLAVAWLGLAVGVVVLLKRRFFCRWVCPMGFCLDGVGWLRRRRQHGLPKRQDRISGTPQGVCEKGGIVKAGRPWRWSGAREIRHCQAPKTPRDDATQRMLASHTPSHGQEARATKGWLRAPPVRRMPRVGPWIVVLTLGGACLGYPLLLWLDPLAIFTGVFVAGERHLGYAVWPAVGFATVLLASILWPHSWCGRVCPLGAFQDLLYAGPRSVRRIARRSAVSLDATGADDGLSRRLLLGAVAGAGAAGIASWAGTDGPRPLRPPNARRESLFVGLCTRCGNCLRSCPSGIIERDPGRHGWSGFWTPVLNFRNGYCHEGCTQCTEVCPSGALLRLRVEDKERVRIGLP
ncbi:MAG: 4Fe-4S binding protein, partial [Planctomycetes bacterium]|nr:4Fe-4S binding protein [Planctomycetota bacterium]